VITQVRLGVMLACLVCASSLDAQTTFDGRSIPWGGLDPYSGGVLAFASTNVINATGEKAAYCGRVFNKDRATKAISKVGFRFGAVTKAGGSALTVSLQNPNSAAGPPMQPDEVQDQTVAIANADAGFTSNAWYQTNALSATRSVAFGEALCVVVEFDGAGRLGADSVVISGLAGITNGGPFNHSVTVLKDGGVWGSLIVIPNIILEFNDGTFGTLMGAFPCSAVGTISYNSGSSPNEYALEFTFPGPVTIDAGGGIWLHEAAGTDIDMIVYDGTSAMSGGSRSLEGNMANNTTGGAGTRTSFAPFDGLITLAASTTYRLGIKPTTANSVSLSYFDVANASHLQAHIGGAEWAITSRTGAAAWSAPTTTRRPFLWPYVSGISSGGGGKVIGGGIGDEASSDTSRDFYEQATDEEQRQHGAAVGHGMSGRQHDRIIRNGSFLQAPDVIRHDDRRTENPIVNLGPNFVFEDARQAGHRRVASRKAERPGIAKEQRPAIGADRDGIVRLGVWVVDRLPCVAHPDAAAFPDAALKRPIVGHDPRQWAERWRDRGAWGDQPFNADHFSAFIDAGDLVAVSVGAVSIVNGIASHKGQCRGRRRHQQHQHSDYTLSHLNSSGGKERRSYLETLRPASEGRAIL
jgi:hypothetical protein